MLLFKSVPYFGFPSNDSITNALNEHTTNQNIQFLLGSKSYCIRCLLVSFVAIVTCQRFYKLHSKYKNNEKIFENILRNDKIYVLSITKDICMLSNE